MELLNEIFEICIIPLLGVLTAFAVQYLRAKSKEIIASLDNDTAQEYVEMITNTVTNCVIATNQTYVETLKKQNKFDADAQKVAFEKTLNAVIAVLSDDAKNYIVKTTGDLNTYLTNLIEAKVNENKVVVM
jgi:D-arabinose 1-dehydrogenase-like Zn-dependent alcohol dehydrogenase